MKELALSDLPDLPRWVEARALLLSDRCDVVRGERPEAGYVVRGTPGLPLLCMVGRPDIEVIRTAVAGWTSEHRVIAPEEAAGHLAEALPGWQPLPATLHLLAPDASVPAPAGEVRLLGEDAEEVLARLPKELREEITTVALPETAIAVAFVDGEPASVCYACWETETLWDVSIDTLEPFRRRGLAEQCSAFLIRHMRERGKEPVWGAEDHNVASLRLAARLGFRPVDRLVVMAPPSR